MTAASPEVLPLISYLNVFYLPILLTCLNHEDDKECVQWIGILELWISISLNYGSLLYPEGVYEVCKFSVKVVQYFVMRALF